MNKSKTSGGLLAVFLVMVVTGGVTAFFFWQGRVKRDPDKAGNGKEVVARLSPERCGQILALKDRCIGYLENGPVEIEVGSETVSGLAEAARGFQQLTVDLPKQRLPVQNLAIARLLDLRNTRGDTSAARQQAKDAVEQLLAFDKDSAIAHWLAANIELHTDASQPAGATDANREAAVALLNKACALDDKNAAFFYALYSAAKPPRDPKPNQVAAEALKSAYALEPRNLYLLTEWLMAQALLNDPSIVDTLAESEEVLQPLAHNIQQRARLDVAATIDQASAAAKAEDWSTVMRLVRMIQFTVRPEEISKSDLTRVDVHPLEFVIYDFSPEFYADNDVAPVIPAEGLTVMLQPVADWGLSDATDVRQIGLTDFDLDGRRDLVVLREGKLEILARNEKAAGWSEICSQAVPAGTVGMIIADLDRDIRDSGAAGAAEPSARFDRVISENTTCFEADPDLLVFGQQGVTILENSFDKESGKRSLEVAVNEPLGGLKQVTEGIVVDIDHDGDLDAVFASDQGMTLWLGDKKLGFRDVTQWSVLPTKTAAVSDLVAVDWDRDVDIDILVTEPTGSLVGYLENLRHGQFRWVAFDESYEQLGKPSSLAVLEANGNASWDLVSTGQQGMRRAADRNAAIGHC